MNKSLNNSLLYPCLTALFILLINSFFSCKKNELNQFETDLALNSRIVRVADSAAPTRIQVYADNDWTVKTETGASWITLDKNGGSGKGEFIANIASNEGQLPRAAKIVVSAANHSDTIILQQKGLTPLLNIVDTSAIGIGKGGNMKIAINTNIPLDQMLQNINYASGNDWMSGLTMADGYLNFKITENPTPQIRSANVYLSYLDALGATVTDSFQLFQNPISDFSNAILKDFAYIKNSLPTGVITDDIYIEGIVVSDKGNANMGQNKNRPENKHLLDKTENAITVYMQSPDGKSGLLLKTKTAGDNIYYRNDRVKLWLKGTTLTKASNPNRVIIQEIPSFNIISKEAGTPVLARELFIKDLTDDDLFTYVKLKDIELSIPFGSFSNIHEGYNQRADCYVQNIRDINGSSMFMLTNTDVAYRRTGEPLPQGSGTIAGILVYEQHPRYGGDIGRYAIRHINREDIALAQDRAAGFSTVLTEWSIFKTEYSSNPTSTQNPLTPDIGSGVLLQSEVPFMNFTATGILGIPDYNSTSTVSDGVVTDGAWYSRNWWNASENRGGCWEIRASTAGITKSLSLQIEGQSNTGGPRYFDVEWSATGNKNEAWNKVGEFTFQDLASSSNTLLTQTAGMKALNFQLPLAASNLPMLYIRLKVKNKTAGTATSDTGGTITASGVSKLSHVSIKYNK